MSRYYLAPATGSVHAAKSIEGAHDAGIGSTFVPCVVIDPEDRKQVERLAALLVSEHATLSDRGVGHSGLKAALREFANPTPPKPEVYEHLVYQRRGKTTESICGKDWIPGAEVTVVGKCPECVAFVEGGWTS